MNTFLEILKIVLPSLVVLAASYYTLDRYLTQDAENRKIEQRKTDKRITLPLQLQAYERIVLLLERIAPEQLLMRVQQPKMTVGQLQRALLLNIRSEYEHNMSQQIYISEEAWELVKSSKENLIRIVNTVVSNMNLDEPAINLSKKLMDIFASIDSSPIQASISRIKIEASELF
jgi:hypothetical protein